MAWIQILPGVGVEFLVAVRGHGERYTGRRRLKGANHGRRYCLPGHHRQARSLPPDQNAAAGRTATAGVLAAAATTASAAVLRAAGIPLAVHGKIPLAAFAQLTFIAAVSGGVLLAMLVRRSSAPGQRFVRITAGLTALSCGVPLAFADATASKIALVVLHLLAAAIIVPVLARHAD